ncbi:MAG: hypothetical protein OXB93_03465 [Cytophagales bacterium]|nr:hypothetical protein [Cytophagales bacterium]
MVSLLREIPGIRWVDWDRGQFRLSEDSESFPLPAVLIHLDRIRWHDPHVDRQSGELTMHIDLYLDSRGDVFSVSPDEERTLRDLHFLEEIYTRLDSFGNSELSSLCRKEDKLLSISPHVLAFRTTFTSQVSEVRTSGSTQKLRPIYKTNIKTS